MSWKETSKLNNTSSNGILYNPNIFKRWLPSKFVRTIRNPELEAYLIATGFPAVKFKRIQYLTAMHALICDVPYYSTVLSDMYEQKRREMQEQIERRNYKLPKGIEALVSDEHGFLAACSTDGEDPIKNYTPYAPEKLARVLNKFTSSENYWKRGFLFTGLSAMYNGEIDLQTWIDEIAKPLATGMSYEDIVKYTRRNFKSIPT